ncbi:MAG: tetratricopeptide repeat protein [Ideonella sp.]|nr:tetratricopeptide repeat protein [Ideonella sp.]
MKSALQEDKKMLAAHLLLGKVLLRAGELKAAEAALEEALKQGVSRSEISIPLGRVYLQLGEPGKLLEQGIPTGLPPAQQAELLSLRGSAQAMTGNIGAATQSFADARALDPRSAAPVMAEASMFMRAGDRDRAKVSAVKATELAPDDASARNLLGTVLHALRDLSGALSAFDKAVALNGKYIDAHVGRATVLVAMGRELEADQELAMVKAWKAVEPRASYLRGMRAEQKGDAATAKAEYADAVGLIDSMPPALRIGSEPLLMAAALSHRALGNLAKAREYLETMVARNGKHLGAQLLLASILVDANEHAKALPMLEGLQRMAPNQPQVLFLLGSIYLARKQHAQAMDYFERAAAITSSMDPVRELGLSQIGLGQGKAGMANLERCSRRTRVICALAFNWPSTMPGKARAPGPFMSRRASSRATHRTWPCSTFWATSRAASATSAAPDKRLSKWSPRTRTSAPAASI